MEKKVLLFSGGLDSMLHEWLIKPDVLLYVDMKTSYSEREIEALNRLPSYYKERIVIKQLPLGEYERENKYLPYRNLILGAIAMQYGQYVYFGFNNHDNAPDKDDTFLRRTNKLFDHLNINCMADMNWDKPSYGFFAPFKDYSKTDLMRKCLSKEMPVEWIQNIRSCYDGVSQKGCGVCNVCFNKAVALLNNGIYEDSLFDTPITDETFRIKLNDIKDDTDAHTQKYIREVHLARRALQQIHQ